MVHRQKGAQIGDDENARRASHGREVAAVAAQPAQHVGWPLASICCACARPSALISRPSMAPT